MRFSLGVEPVIESAEQFRRYIAAEVAEGTELLKSAGFANFDREAIRTASRVSYPASANGRTVAMVLGFNEAVTSKAQAEGGAIVTAWADEQDRKVRLAQQTTAQQPDS